VFSLGDVISQYFFGAWWDATPDDIKTDPTAFFFPAAGDASLLFENLMFSLHFPQVP
jgi:hypothetical protein